MSWFLEPLAPCPPFPMAAVATVAAAEAGLPEAKKRWVADVPAPPSVLQRHTTELFDVAGEPYELGLHWEASTEQQSIKVDELIAHCHNEFFAEEGGEWLQSGPFATTMRSEAGHIHGPELIL